MNQTCSRTRQQSLSTATLTELLADGNTTNVEQRAQDVPDQHRARDTAWGGRDNESTGDGVVQRLHSPQHGDAVCRVDQQDDVGWRSKDLWPTDALPAQDQLT